MEKQNLVPSHRKPPYGKKLLGVILLNLSITVVQVIGGIFSRSLALLSDAVHNLGDTSAIAIAYIAGRIGNKSADIHRTFGYKRIEIIAAFFNAIVLIAICLFLFYSAWERFLHPTPVKGKLMFITAVFGLLANLISVVLLECDKTKNLNIKATYLHLLGDTLSSVAVIAGGIVVWLFDVDWIDPLITVGVGIYIIYHTLGVVKDTVDILMQTVPKEVDVEEIKKAVEAIEEIDNIHYVHVWKLDDSQIFLDAHLSFKENLDLVKMMTVRGKAENLIRKQFGINHITLQTGYRCCNGTHRLICRDG